MHVCVCVCVCVCVFCVFVQVCAFVVVTAVVVVVCVCACVSFVRARLVRYVVGLVVCFPLCLASSPFFFACCLGTSCLVLPYVGQVVLRIPVGFFSGFASYLCSSGSLLGQFSAKNGGRGASGPKRPPWWRDSFPARGKKHFFNAFFGG